MLFPIWGHLFVEVSLFNFTFQFYEQYLMIVPAKMAQVKVLVRGYHQVISWG